MLFNHRVLLCKYIACSNNDGRGDLGLVEPEHLETGVPFIQAIDLIVVIQYLELADKPT